jgi:diphthamide biosynthesis methyltransferase
MCCNEQEADMLTLGQTLAPTTHAKLSQASTG